MTKKKVKYNLTLSEGMDKNIKALQKVIKKEFKIELSKSEIVRMILLHSMPCYNFKLTVKEALMEAKYL